MVGRFVAYTAVLYAGLVHNLFCVPEDVFTCRGEFRRGHQSADCCLVVGRMRYPGAGPWDSMSRRGWDGEPVPYRSQFGLQGVGLAAAARAAGATPERAAEAGGLLVGLATAAVLAAFFADVARRVGPVAGHAGVILTACSPPLVGYGPALYWALPTMLGPFALTWLAYPGAAGRPARSAALWAGVAGLVCVKGLCGYEYVTAVVLSPVAAVVYHRAAAGDGARRWVRPAAPLVAAGLVGFAAAVGAHAAQVAAATGGDGFAPIRDRAAARTGLAAADGPPAIAYPLYVPEWDALSDRVRLPVRCFANYFLQPAAASPQTWGPARFAVPLGGVLAAGGAVLAALWRRRDRFPAAAALAPAAAVGLAGAASWQVLAADHMVHHGHLNLLVFYLPGLPLVYAGLGAGLQAAAGRRAGAVAAGLVGAAVVAAGANAAVVTVRAADRAAAEGRAADRVRAVLRGDEAAVGPAGRAFPPRVTTLPADPPYLPHGGMFVPFYPPAVPPAVAPVGAAGWVTAPKERSGRLPLTVVAVRGGEVVPARVGYFRLTPVERLYRGQVACVGYQAVVPPGEPPRLFAVPDRPGEPVVELTAGR
jgi:hypothetical protein